MSSISIVNGILIKPLFFEDKELYFSIIFNLQTKTLDLKKASPNFCLFNEDPTFSGLFLI